MASSYVVGYTYRPSLGPVVRGTGVMAGERAIVYGITSVQIRLIKAAWLIDPMLTFYNVHLITSVDGKNEIMLMLDKISCGSHEFAQHVLQFTFWYILAFLYSKSELNCFNENKDMLKKLEMKECTLETSAEVDDCDCDCDCDEQFRYTVETRIPISRLDVPKMIGRCGTNVRSIVSDLSTNKTTIDIQIENSHPLSKEIPVLCVYVSGNEENVSEHELRSTAFAVIEACFITVHT